MKLTYNILRNVLSLCEYHYRLGVWESYSTPDDQAVRDIAEYDDGYSTHQYLGKKRFDSTKPRDLGIYVDILVMICNDIGADHLRTFFRLANGAGHTKEICGIIDYHYRKGLRDGQKLGDKRKAKLFFESVKHGCAHPHLFHKTRKWETFQYFDVVKKRLNEIHLIRQEKGLSSSYYGLSCKVGELVMQEKMQKWKKHEIGRAHV